VTRFDWRPNVAPSQIVETIISVNREKRLGPMRWGFVSSTATEPKLAPINAREGLVHLSAVPGYLPTP
jgi:putative SOS response-associated peptidase YedK